MYQTQDWAATDDADWGVAIEIIDATTNLPMDISSDGITFDMAVKERGCQVLYASSADGTITKPDTTSIQWLFTAAQMSALCVGTTYEVGVRMTNTSGVTQVIVGNLAIVDGGF